MTPDAPPAGRPAPGVGDRIPRREVRALLTGEATFTDDVDAPAMAHLAILRSRHAHAELLEVDVSAAEALPDVLAVLTGDGLAAADIPGTVPGGRPPPDSGGPWALRGEFRSPDRPLLARHRVRFTGEAVAAVVATDRAVAHDALEQVQVRYDRLPAVTDPEAADDSDAPRLHGRVPGNVAFDWRVGDAARSDDAFDRAAVSVAVTAASQRLVPSAIEPRAAVADYDPAEGRLTVTMSTQVPHESRRYLADALGLSVDRVHVRAPHVGGGFGSKEKFYPAEAIAAWAAVRTGRPVKWVAPRSAEAAAGIHGRGYRKRARLAVSSSGAFLGLRVDTRADLGAYLSKNAPRIATAASNAVATGAYAIPAIDARVTGVVTNTAPVDAYRGSGRPETIYVLERLVDLAAAELGVDPATLRRQNLLAPDAFPYDTPTGYRYDSGDYEGALDRALAAVDYDATRARQRRLREAGRYLGVGLACYVEGAGIERPTTASLRVDPTGAVTAHTGTADQGQGHATTYAQVLGDRLDLPVDRITVEEGDTDHVASGTGTYASRSTIAAGAALAECADALLDRGRELAAAELEASPANLRYDRGRFAVGGSPDRSVSLGDLAATADEGGDGAGPGLEATATAVGERTFPFGCHVAVVEVDPATGAIDVDRYVAVDDCGVRVNPALVEGQVHGGVAQGVGQALFERAVYDDAGNLATATLQDYALPRAGALPDLETATTTTPSPSHPLGVKGVGENATLPAPAAVVNAVNDALAPSASTTSADRRPPSGSGEPSAMRAASSEPCHHVRTGGHLRRPSRQRAAVSVLGAGTFTGRRREGPVWTRRSRRPCSTRSPRRIRRRSSSPRWSPSC